MAHLKVKIVGEEINKIKTNIDAVNDMKRKEIARLEEDKRQVRDATRTTVGKTESVLQRAFDDLVKNKPRINERLDQIQKGNGDRYVSMSMVDEFIKDVEKNISQLEAERVNVITELETRQRNLIKQLESVEQIDLLTNALTYKIYELQHAHRKKIDALERELQKIKEEQNHTDQKDTVVQIEMLEKKIQDMCESQEEALKSLTLQKAELTRESRVRMEDIETVLRLVNEQRQKFLREYEEQLSQVSNEEEAEYIRSKIANLKEQMLEESKFEKNSEEKMLMCLEERGLRLTPSGRFLTKTGRLYTYEQAEKLGLLDDIERNQLNRIFKCYTETESSATRFTTTIASTSTLDSEMDPEDVHYLKKFVAVPLVLALAEVAAKQPRDPIHYLAHWLIKYRYNQEIEEVKKTELAELLAERERLAEEKRRRELEEEARLAIWEMVYRAVEEALKRELEAELLRIALETEFAEEEGLMDDLLEKQMLEEEARDQLGALDAHQLTRDWDQQ